MQFFTWVPICTAASHNRARDHVAKEVYGGSFRRKHNCQSEIATSTNLVLYLQCSAFQARKTGMNIDELKLE